MIAKCTKCGHQSVVDKPLYDSPVVKCSACGEHFYEKKIIEAALFPPHNINKEKVGFFTYTGAIIGVLIFIFGFVEKSIENDTSYLILSVFGLVFLVSQVYIIWKANHAFAKRKEIYEIYLRESHKRLKDKQYQDLLINSSGCDEHISVLLKRYNKENKISFLDSIEQTKNHNTKNPTTEEPQTTANDYNNNNHKEITEDKLICKKCGIVLGEDSDFCHKCGAKVDKKTINFCRKCGNKLIPHSSFCNRCGTKINL